MNDLEERLSYWLAGDVNDRDFVLATLQNVPWDDIADHFPDDDRDAVKTALATIYRHLRERD